MDNDAALFDDFLFDLPGENYETYNNNNNYEKYDGNFSPGSSSAEADAVNSDSSESGGNNNERQSTPATDISPLSPPKFAELDLDGFTPGGALSLAPAPTQSAPPSAFPFPLDPPATKSKSTSTSKSPSANTSNNLLSSRTSSSSTNHSTLVSPGDTQLDSSFSNDQFASTASNATPSTTKPVLSIQPPRPRQQRYSHSQNSMDMLDPLIDPSLTYNSIPSATSMYSPAFSQPASALPPSALSPQSSTHSAFSRQSPEPTQQDQSPTDDKGKKPAQKRKRTRKSAAATAATSNLPADVEKQARFLERNRNAASRCRARRKAQNDRLETRAGELEREREGLRLLAQSLVSEKAELLARVLDLGCEDGCSGGEFAGRGRGQRGHGQSGQGMGAGKPPRDLLVSALGELMATNLGKDELDMDLKMDDIEE